MIMPVRRPDPPEHRRRWVSLPGRVSGHEFLDRRNFLTKWLGQKFPMTQQFLGGTHHILVIELNPEAREQALDKLIVPILDRDAQQVPPSITYEIFQKNLCLYPVGSLVSVSFGISNQLDQWLGCQPLRCEVKPINSLEELKTMRGAVFPQQSIMF